MKFFFSDLLPVTVIVAQAVGESCRSWQSFARTAAAA